jgi:hypothetical protein
MDRMKTFILWRLTSVGPQYVNYFVDRLKQTFLRGPPGFWWNWVPLDKNVKQNPIKPKLPTEKFLRFTEFWDVALYILPQPWTRLTILIRNIGTYVVLEKDGEDQLDRSCEAWSIAESQGG